MGSSQGRFGSLLASLLICLLCCQSGCSTIAGTRETYHRRASKPTFQYRYTPVVMSKKERYFYRGLRFFSDEGLFILMYATLISRYTLTPFTVVFGLAELILTTAADTALAPFTYCLDAKYESDLESLPVREHRVVEVKPEPKKKVSEGGANKPGPGKEKSESGAPN